jgi:hypothetical protein
MVEDQGGGKPETGRRVEPVPQLDRGQRVQAQFLEGEAGIDVGGVLSQHLGRVSAHQIEHVVHVKNSPRMHVARSARPGARHLRTDRFRLVYRPESP